MAVDIHITHKVTVTMPVYRPLQQIFSRVAQATDDGLTMQQSLKNHTVQSQVKPVDNGTFIVGGKVKR